MQFIHQPHDKLFKQAMGDIRVARDFFEAHLPEKILQKINLKSLTPQKQSFINKDFKGIEADVVYAADRDYANVVIRYVYDGTVVDDELLLIKMSEE
jgi:predicted transposase/invertase (TIGR01784 family)